ncbi:MAG: glutamine-hydrolyzing carbamoyl-phosphate synthase small subunit [Micrococcales bacterium]|nr:glutamine-hydrolyzing carbamoyl-phosphate synthase small subunit [Micrococcales bacterium]
MTPAVLMLEDGRTFRGEAYGAVGETVGEIVFTTAMTGYQETLTDPSYHRQIVVMTAPHIGNTGVNDDDPESKQIWVAGYVVRDPSRVASSWRAQRRLDDDLVAAGVVGISGIDTRALTRHLRDRGVMRAGIFSGAALDDRADADRLAQVQAAPAMQGAHLAAAVSTTEPYVVAARGPDGAPLDRPLFRVVALDLGIKSMTPYRMAERGIEVHVLPATSTLDDLLAVAPDGVFFSNGPGDPGAARHEIALLRSVLDRKVPFFGICFGNQLFGRALGFETYKLVYGHRGTNQPVLDRATGKVEITTHNHGFAVDAPLEGETVAPHDGGRYGRVKVSHVNLNDNVVEGLEALDLPAFTVQYHPEAAAGPRDASYLFDRFCDLMRTHSPNAGPDSTGPDSTSSDSTGSDEEHAA